MPEHLHPLLTPALLSFQIGTIATLFALLLGGALAWALHGRRGPLVTVFESVVMLPLVFPPTILGFYMLVLLGRTGPIGKLIGTLFGTSVIFTLGAAIIAATASAVPIMYKAIKIDFEAIHPDILGCARIEGASEWAILRFIRIPLAARAIMAGLLLSFLRALGEFGATLMVAGNIPGRTQTLSLAIYGAVMNGELAEAHLLAAVLVAICLVLILLSRKVERGVGRAIGARD